MRLSKKSVFRWFSIISVTERKFPNRKLNFPSLIRRIRAFWWDRMKSSVDFLSSCSFASSQLPVRVFTANWILAFESQLAFQSHPDCATFNRLCVIAESYRRKEKEIVMTVTYSSDSKYRLTRISELILNFHSIQLLQRDSWRFLSCFCLVGEDRCVNWFGSICWSTSRCIMPS